MRIRVKFFKWRMHRKMRLTTQGLYAAYYIIDKYLTMKKPDDYNEAYERPITHTYERMKHTHMFGKLKIEENRELPAFFTLGNYILVASDDMQEKIYNYLGDWPRVDVLKKYVKSGVFV